MIARSSLRALAPRVIAATVAVAAGLVAWRVGGGAEISPVPPRPSAPAVAASTLARSATTAKPGEGYEVSVRLVEVADEAHYDVPRADIAKPIMKAHWRQLKPPLLSATGDAARSLTTIALRASDSETQWAMPVGKDGEAWAPEARVWNMNEGSFDQRESFALPAPGTITFRVAVPQGAKLTFAEGTVNATDEATVFVVSVLDAGRTLHEVYRHALPPRAARRWTDASCDLSAYAGQTVELRLGIETARAKDSDVRPEKGSTAAVPASEYSGPGNGRPSIDGGVVREDVLATPSTAVALWGNPTILARTTPRVPFNVLWIVVDALRPDVIASFHDDVEDARKEAAPLPPLEALLPKVPGLTPAIDELTKRGARFTQAYSAGSWTRPGTLAMLAGARSSEIGIDTTAWMPTPYEIRRFYTSDPPLLPLALRRHGVTTRAFVNNYFMVGYAPVGLDMGFERVDDHRYRTRDTMEITADATNWIKENKDTRFFAFVNYNSPHEPYEPPAKHLAKVPPPPAGPKDSVARLYMAEAAKDDEAIGALLRTLDETGLRERTIIVVTADHGETMSSAHAGTSGLDKMPIRYHHSVSNFEETTKVPIVIVAPGVIPPNTEVKTRVRTVDIAPTVLELVGMDPHAKMSGRSMLALAKGQPETEERVVVSEGRGSRAIMHGRWRLLVREGAAKIVIQDDKTREREFELFDLVDDPGERRDLASKRPDVLAEMKARLDAALKNAPVAGESSRAATVSQADAGADTPPTIHLRFAGGAQPRRVSGTITVGNAKTKAKSFNVKPVELGRDAFRTEGTRIDVALRTSPSAPVGFDIELDPPTTPITWELWLDDKPWPEDGVFGGPFGLPARVLARGLATDEARLAAHASSLPTIDTNHDVGLFVVRERRGESDGAHETTDEGAEEMARLLREWGYAHGSGGGKK